MYMFIGVCVYMYTYIHIDGYVNYGNQTDRSDKSNLNTDSYANMNFMDKYL
jgi:hypothetical protein